MKKILAIFIMISTLSFGAEVGLEVGNLLPTLELKNYSNEIIATSENYYGKITIYNIGASWCPPCAIEKPLLNDLYNREIEDLNVVSIMGASSIKKTKKFFQEHPIDFTAYYDKNNAIINQLLISVFPTSYIVDKDGVILEKVFGSPQWDKIDYEMLEGLRDGD